MPNPRPEWCPHSSCQYLVSTCNQLCVGRLPEPLPHYDDFNTHRMCQRGAKDDGEWMHVIEINHSDCYHINRMLKVVMDDCKK